MIALAICCVGALIFTINRRLQWSERETAQRIRQKNGELQALLQERAEQADAARALAEASAALATALELEPLHEIILQQMARVIPFDTAHIYEYRDSCAVVAGGLGLPGLPVGYRLPLLPGEELHFPQAEIKHGN